MTIPLVISLVHRVRSNAWEISD